MQKYLVEQLLAELQAVDPRVMIVPNVNRPGLSNIIVNGVDICPIPQFELQDEHTPDYTYTFPNDLQAPMKTYDEAKEMAERFLKKIQDPAVAAEFFDTTYLLPDTSKDAQYGVHKV